VGFIAHDVTVFIFGGAARIPGLLEIKPKYEAYVAIVGPISSFVLAFAVYMISLSMAEPPEMLTNAALINVVFAVFNTLPLFPMDGGRVLRAGLSHKLGQEKGTNGAVWTTTILGGAIAAAGLFFSRWNLSVIMVLVIMMAWSERNALRQKMLLEKTKARIREMGYEIIETDEELDGR
jgi:stage IV sporulation protein FB